MKLDRDPSLLEIFRRYGNAARLAEALGVSKQAVSSWEMLPVKWVRVVSQATGIHPYRIRPDLYIEGFWNMGRNTAEIAEEMRLSEPLVEHYVHKMLARRKVSMNDNTDCAALPPVSKPPLEGE